MTSYISLGNALLPMSIAEVIKDNIYLNKVLSKISFDDSTVKIEFTDQSCCNYDLVVLAIPASTFESIDFSNIESKLSDINAIQYGKNFKIAMPVNLSTANSYRSVVTDSTNHDETIQLVYAHKPISNPSKFMNITATGFGIPQQEFVNEPLQVTQQNYNVYKEPIMHYWHHDIYSMGSYSGYSTSSSKELDNITYHDDTCYKTMFLPIQDTIFFVGEHTTILECIGTIEAAVESGERVAQAIIKKYKK
ncbi:FAD-dependent oxidoreductase [Candidatus Midichloria mitochondrii]|uniref:FAD-dependent oxidoreductase n=1 Tax=Candidatus Midichloria mitochondrii TaxID=234827 RepID=UPI00135F1308|nr:FAD-dependent oxidoreductase [Candidatus Midichloria mitochondrii]